MIIPSLLGSGLNGSPDVATLQNALNRFADTVLFPRLIVDGVVGGNTTAAAYAVGSFMPQVRDSLDVYTLNILISQNSDIISNNAGGLATALNAIAKDIELPFVEAPTRSSPASGGGTARVPPSPSIPMMVKKSFFSFTDVKGNLNWPFVVMVGLIITGGVAAWYSESKKGKR